MENNSLWAWVDCDSVKSNKGGSAGQTEEGGALWHYNSLIHHNKNAPQKCEAFYYATYII